MSTGIEHVTSRRLWFVPDVVVWGTPGLGEVHYLTVEDIDSTVSVLYGHSGIEPAEQQVSFQQLVDHRGNQLPDTISSPVVIPRSRSQHAVFVTGCESNEHFKIASAPGAPGPVTVDLLIMELGD